MQKGAPPVADELRNPKVQDALINLTGALVSTRTVLKIIASHPGLVLNQTQRTEILQAWEEGANNLDKAINAIQQLAGPQNAG